jgi:hypothetical protein
MRPNYYISSFAEENTCQLVVCVHSSIYIIDYLFVVMVGGHKTMQLLSTASVCSSHAAILIFYLLLVG